MHILHRRMPSRTNTQIFRSQHLRKYTKFKVSFQLLRSKTSNRTLQILSKEINYGKRETSNFVHLKARADAGKNNSDGGDNAT